MKYLKQRCIVGVMAAGGLLGSVQAHATDLEITVRNLLPNQGHVLLGLFPTEEGFPDKPISAQLQQQIAVKGGQVTTVFKGLAPGRYAVMVVQDLNGNGRIDYNFVGMPKEPYGASNNRVPLLSAPTYEDALVTLGPERTSVMIEVRRP